jgi:hypothetical protein
VSQFGVEAMYGNALEFVLDKWDEGDDHSWCADGCVDPAPQEGEWYIQKGGAVWTFGEWTRISARVLTGLGEMRASGARCVRPAPPDDLDGGVDAGPDSGPDGGK